MIDPESDNFDKFLSDSVVEHEDAEQLELTVNRFLLFLADRGVIFDASAFLNDPMTPNVGFIDPEEIRFLAQNNILRVQLIAGHKMLSDITASMGQQDYDLKKQLQAMALANGCSREWLDLIDAEFPGEPLSDGDSGYIYGNSVVRALSHETFSVEHGALIENIANYLVEHGRTELTENEIIAAQSIAVSLITLNIRQNDRIRGNLAESARIMIIERGLDLNLWNGLVSHFFEPTPE